MPCSCVCMYAMQMLCHAVRARRASPSSSCRSTRWCCQQRRVLCLRRQPVRHEGARWLDLAFYPHHCPDMESSKRSRHPIHMHANMPAEPSNLPEGTRKLLHKPAKSREAARQEATHSAHSERTGVWAYRGPSAPAGAAHPNPRTRSAMTIVLFLPCPPSGAACSLSVVRRRLLSSLLSSAKRVACFAF